MGSFNASENLIHHKARAKYIRQPDGSLRLACVQSFSQPRFRQSGWEESKKTDSQLDADLLVIDESDEQSESPSLVNIERASRRAKINAFDTILCNPDLDTFATFTYRPEDDIDRASYDDCYKTLSVWLSNRVQRRGLKYVIVPEHHKSGDIHFHGIMNSEALKLSRAVSPRTGHALTRNGLPIYNLTDWKAGFSTAQIIGQGESDRDKVAKYIFKYMGKQVDQRIGGRYALIGGACARPVYVYGDTADEFLTAEMPKYQRHVDVSEGLGYDEYSFI